MKDEKLIDHIAEALCNSQGRQWSKLAEHGRGWWREQAKSALRGLTEAGYVCAPKEPTEEMVAAWPRHNHGAGHERAIYHAMLATLQEGRT